LAGAAHLSNPRKIPARTSMAVKIPLEKPAAIHVPLASMHIERITPRKNKLNTKPGIRRDFVRSSQYPVFPIFQ